MLEYLLVLEDPLRNISNVCWAPELREKPHNWETDSNQLQQQQLKQQHLLPVLCGWTRPQQQQSQHHLAPLLCIQVQRKRRLLLESTSSTAIPTTGSSLTSGPVYTDAREALTEEPIRAAAPLTIGLVYTDARGALTEAPLRAAAPLKSPICILFIKF